MSCALISSIMTVALRLSLSEAWIERRSPCTTISCAPPEPPVTLGSACASCTGAAATPVTADGAGALAGDGEASVCAEAAEQPIALTNNSAVMDTPPRAILSVLIPYLVMTSPSVLSIIVPMVGSTRPARSRA